MQTQTTNQVATEAERCSGPELAGVRWVEVWGRRYPSLKALGGAWHLMAHPNGPAITTTEFGYMGSLAYESEEVPESVRKAAIEALMDWAKNQPSYPRDTSTDGDQAAAPEAARGQKPERKLTNGSYQNETAGRS